MWKLVALKVKVLTIETVENTTVQALIAMCYWNGQNTVRSEGVRPYGVRPEGVCPYGVRPEGVCPHGVCVLHEWMGVVCVWYAWCVCIVHCGIVLQ